MGENIFDIPQFGEPPTPPDENSSGTSSTVTWSGATEITSAGTYSGSYSSNTADQNAVLIDTSDTVILENPTVTKTGESGSANDNYSFYGINSAVMAKGGGTTSIIGGSVSSSASGGNAIFSYGGNGGTNGAAGDGTTVYVSGTNIYTSSDGSGGIMTTGGGNTIAENLSVTTEGQSSAAIRTDRGGGNVTVNGGNYTSNGLGSPAIYSTAAISVSGAQLTSNKSEGVCIEGQNSVALSNCTLTANNTQTNGNATFLDSVMIYQSMSGDSANGTSTFTMSDGVINSNSGHVFHVTNTDAVINLSNVTINNSSDVLLSVCDDGWSGASNVATLNASNQNLSGNILVGNDSTLTLNLSGNSTFSGNLSGNISNASGTAVSTDIGEVNIVLDSTSKWYLTGTTYVTSFSGNASDIINNGYDIYVNNSLLSGTSANTVNFLSKEDDTYTYSGGTATIASYATGEKIKITSDVTGIGLSDNDFKINSGTGTLTIKNARGQLLEVTDANDSTVAYGYMANDGGELDGKNYSQLEVIIGANDASNIITAGNGSSSLWGGVGGADTLTGGAGQDIFFFGKNDGADVINNASSSDVVNLYDVSLSDIVAANISGNAVSATFNTGATLQINSAENLSPTFQLADSSWKYNHSSGNWQSQ